MAKYFNNLGIISKFQQGGTAPQEDIQQQIVALVQAAMQGDQKATETINQIMQAAQQGDQQAAQLAQMIQQVAQAMQQQAGGQTPAARYGAKLSYIHKISTGCADDEELVYLAKGGHICPECIKKAQAAQIEADKCGGKAKKVSKACGGKKFFKDGKRISK